MHLLAGLIMPKRVSFDNLCVRKSVYIRSVRVWPPVTATNLELVKVGGVGLHQIYIYVLSCYQSDLQESARESDGCRPCVCVCVCHVSPHVIKPVSDLVKLH